MDIFRKFLDVAPDREPLSFEETEQFYSLGYSLYQAGNAKEASKIFEVLCAQQPLEAKNWFALASARQENGEFEKALHSWAMAGILKKEDPYPHFHAAECCLSLNQFEEAALALAAASKRTAGNLELNEKIVLLREQWELKECLTTA